MKSLPRWFGAAAVAVLMSAPAFSQEIKISHQFKANADARDQATRVFVKEVNARDPNLKFRIYPAQSLGIKPVAQLDALQNGTLEMAVFPMSYAVGKAQEFSIIIMPGTVPTLEHAMKLRGTPFHKKLQDLAHAERHPHRHLVVDARRVRHEGSRDHRAEERRGPEAARRRPDLRDDAEGGRRLGGQHAVDRDLPVAAVRRAERHADLGRDLRQHAPVRADEDGHPAGQVLAVDADAAARDVQAALGQADAGAAEDLRGGAGEVATSTSSARSARPSADMEKEYKKAGAKVREMTQAEYDEWVALARDTAWKEFAAKSADRRRTCSTRCSPSSDDGTSVTTTR